MFTSEFLLNIALPLFLLVSAYFIGGTIERRHYEAIRKREKALMRFPAITLTSIPDEWQVEGTGLVAGNVVVSIDYFKRFLSSLRSLVGGRIKSYETLLDRARREAILRMKESARASGYQAIINVRLETARLASGRNNGKGTAGVEVLAFGTGLSLRDEP